jgi:hypothetical protein
VGIWPAHARLEARPLREIPWLARGRTRPSQGARSRSRNVAVSPRPRRRSEPTILSISGRNLHGWGTTLTLKEGSVAVVGTGEDALVNGPPRILVRGGRPRSLTTFPQSPMAVGLRVGRGRRLHRESGSEAAGSAGLGGGGQCGARRRACGARERCARRLASGRF